jgi:hypothetical protein
MVSGLRDVSVGNYVNGFGFRLEFCDVWEVVVYETSVGCDWQPHLNVAVVICLACHLLCVIS